MRIQSINLLLSGALFLCLSAAGQSSQNPAPSQITTTDGRTYNQVEVLRVEPDGLVVRYQPERPGLGLAKLKFRNLPDSLRNQYGYEAQRAAEFETQQAQATAQWRAQPAVDPLIQRYRLLAEWNRALAGDTYASYSVSLDRNGKVSAQGFTGSVYPYGPYYGVGLPSLGFPFGSTAMPANPVGEDIKPGVSRGGGY